MPKSQVTSVLARPGGSAAQRTKASLRGQHAAHTRCELQRLSRQAGTEGEEGETGRALGPWTPDSPDGQEAQLSGQRQCPAVPG